MASKILPLDYTPVTISHLQGHSQRVLNRGNPSPGLGLNNNDSADQTPTTHRLANTSIVKGTVSSTWSSFGAGHASESEMNSIQPGVIAYLILDYDMQLGGKLTFCHFCSNEPNSDKFPPYYFVAAGPPALLLKGNQRAQGAWKIQAPRPVPLESSEADEAGSQSEVCLNLLLPTLTTELLSEVLCVDFCFRNRNSPIVIQRPFMFKVKCSKKFSNNSEVWRYPQYTIKDLAVSNTRKCVCQTMVTQWPLHPSLYMTVGPRAMFACWLTGQLQPSILAMKEEIHRSLSRGLRCQQPWKLDFLGDAIQIIIRKHGLNKKEWGNSQGR